MTEPSRKPLERILGNDEEAVAFSNGSRLASWLNKTGLLNWLDLKANFLPRSNVMNITQAWSNDFSVSGTGTDQFDPAVHEANFVQLTGFTLGTGTPGNGFTIDNNALVIPVDGYYIAEGWLNFRHTNNNTAVGVVFGVEQAANPGTIIYGSRVNTQTMPNGDRIGDISGIGELPNLKAGDKISVWLVANNTGTITCTNASLLIHQEAE